jgi:predicted nucleotidyltransferase
MKTLQDLQLPKNVLDALQTARDRINAEFAVARIVLFGSVVRGEDDEESDVDLLVVLKDPQAISYAIESRIWFWISTLSTTRTSVS